MAPAYKLIYSNGRGLGEAIRYLFKYGGIEFEDVRINFEDWPKMKDTTPFGQLPVLEHNGKKLSQSIAIARYIAHQVKLTGKDEWENAEIDAIVYAIQDLRLKIFAAAFEQDEDKKKKLKEQAINEVVPNYLPRFEALVQKNNGYLALGRLTWADLYFASFILTFNDFLGEDIIGSKYPNLKALVEKVENLPGIKQWIEVRPKTSF